MSQDAATECNSRPLDDQLSNFTIALECSLRNPTPAGSTLQLELFFGFNVSAVSLETSSLAVMFSVIDGLSGNVSDSRTLNVTLDAVGDYGITSVVSQERYQAFRNIINRNASTIPLNQTGPLLNFRVSVRNTRDATNGTAFPRTTLLIHLPVEFRERPLLIPTSVVVTSGTAVCAHSDAIPSGLSVIQEPTGFIPPLEGPRPSSKWNCDDSEQFKCGTIVCTILDLGPAPQPPVEFALFAQLFSPGVILPMRLNIFSELFEETELPRQGAGSVTNSTVSFTVSPAVTEVQQACVPYWVVVVAVVLGILALLVIIGFLACCGLFRRWYKSKQTEAVNGNGTDQTDSDLFQRRTIPPIPGITQSGSGHPELMGYVSTGGGFEEEKEKEAEAEEELEKEQMELATAAESQDDNLGEYLNYDPSLGVHEDDGQETDL